MRPSDSRETGLPLPRASQVPRLLFLNAPSPVTLGSPLPALKCLFSNGFRLQPSRQLGHSQFQRNEAESSSLLLWLIDSPSSASLWGLLLSAPGRLHVGHSVVMLVSFQTNNRGRDSPKVTPPSEPYVQISRIRLSSHGFPARSSRTSAGQETALLACSTRQRLGEGSTGLLQCHSS
jgi:hypothetical protein